jgi:hypothetical protein
MHRAVQRPHPAKPLGPSPRFIQKNLPRSKMTRFCVMITQTVTADTSLFGCEHASLSAHVIHAMPARRQAPWHSCRKMPQHVRRERSFRPTTERRFHGLIAQLQGDRATCAVRAAGGPSGNIAGGHDAISAGRILRGSPCL